MALLQILSTWAAGIPRAEAMTPSSLYSQHPAQDLVLFKKTLFEGMNNWGAVIPSVQRF